MNLQNLKDAAALWGALTGTVGLCWTIYAEITRRRPRMRVSVGKNVWLEQPYIPGDEPNEYVDFEFANVGLTDITLRGYAFCNFGTPGWTMRMDLHGSFPKKLAPGEIHQERISFKEFLWYDVDPGSVILLGFDTMGRTYLAKGRRFQLLLWHLRWFFVHARNNWAQRAKKRRVTERVRSAREKKKAGQFPI